MRSSSAHALFFCSLCSLAALGACKADDDAETSSDELNAKPTCLPTLACEAPSFPEQETRPWRHPVKSRAASLGGARHRGRDLFVVPGAKQTIIGKLAYGADKDLEDEEVDVFVQRGCSAGWEKLGTALTTSPGSRHSTVEGIEDSEGRLYFEIPQNAALGLGLHRIRLVVAGDGTSTDLYVDVVPPKTPIFVSDVDGTLTTSENAEILALLFGRMAGARADAAEALRTLAAKGYRPMYVTARPEWEAARTRAFLAKHGFPLGVLHTSTELTGAGFGESAASFKTDVMKMLAGKGLVPAFAFGNKSSDSDAYTTITPEDRRIFVEIEGPYVGRRIDGYASLLPELAQLPQACK